MNSSDIPCPPSTPDSGNVRPSLDTLLSNLPGMVYRCRNDPSWTMEFVSTRAQELTGYPAQALLDGSTKYYTSLVHPDDIDALQHEASAALAERRPFQVTYRITTASGAQKWVWEHGTAVYDAAGTAQAVEGFICDVTQRKETEKKLIESEARFRNQASLLDKAQDAIIVRGMDHCVLYWNKSAERLYGWTAEEAIGQPINQMIYQDIASYSEADRTVLAFSEWSGKIMQRRKDGSLLPVEAHCTLVVDDEDRPKSVLLINTDITQRKALKARGVGFSLDDFGTGHSSLSDLKRLPLDHLKIDQSFVRDVLTDVNNATIACTIVALGRSLDLQVIAEGVETEAQQDFLALHGCHTYQGYLFNRPLSIDEFDAFEQEKNGIGIRKPALADGDRGERSPDAIRHSG